VSLTSDLAAFRKKVEQRQKAIFATCVADVQRSIVEGSPVTGSPGQPRDTSNLAGSWQPTFEAPFVALVSTNVRYARAIEEGIIEPHNRRAYTRKDGTKVRATTVRGSRITYQSGGGPHSVKLTRVNWQRIVDATVAEVVR
jgi:hypothetical protein